MEGWKELINEKSLSLEGKQEILHQLENTLMSMNSKEDEIYFEGF